MEVRDPLHGAIELTPPESAVIDNEFFQRLRSVKQLGFTEFAFPGATHNRYSHSLGVMHLSGVIFDQIFQGFLFSSKTVKWRLRQAVKLAALLHDIGHGPLSHTTEYVMPPLSELTQNKNAKGKANHEDYTIKILTFSSMSEVLKKEFPDMLPIHVAQIIDQTLKVEDDFFIDQGINFRPLLGQLVSSELDCDRMDYLRRDSYYCGTNYGQIELDWLISNLTLHIQEENAYLALSRKALYTFDDFLLSRLHMFLMVYFHHKAVVYDEMLLKYLTSEDCGFFLPAKLTEYVHSDDYKLYTHLKESRNEFAKRISERKPFKLFFESRDCKKVAEKLKSAGFDFLQSASFGNLSKYSSGLAKAHPIFVIEDDLISKPKITKIEEATEIFNKYEGARRIERIYVRPEDVSLCQKLF
ncbi:MAG: HD domain-containing protein [Oligoflexia bacterium]|nr:HD domain-containing protein [Oligoflexia bacterium]